MMWSSDRQARVVSPGVTARLLSLVAACLIAGCASTTALRVRGTEGAAFSATFHSNGAAGTVATVIHEASSGVVLETDSSQFSFDVRKEDPSADLVVEVVRDGRTVFTAAAPPGAQGVRGDNLSGTWTRRAYP